MEKSDQNLTRGYSFLKPPPVQDIPQSKETVILFGDSNDPLLQQARQRIEALGRPVQIQPRPDHDTGLGICGKHMCTCTEPCQSIHYNQPNA